MRLQKDAGDVDAACVFAFPRPRASPAKTSGLMKQIQERLGHSDFSTTADIYSHLYYTAKLNSAEMLVTMQAQNKPINKIKGAVLAKNRTKQRLWRSGWDSNPRDVSIKLISSHSALLERAGIYQNAEETTTGKNS
jgi:hypothetical protein